MIVVVAEATLSGWSCCGQQWFEGHGAFRDVSPGTADVRPPALCQQIFTRAVTVSLAPRRTEVMQWGGGPHCITSVLRGRVEGGRGQRVLLDSCRSCIFWFLVETPGGPPEASCNFFWRVGVLGSGLRRVARIGGRGFCGQSVVGELATQVSAQVRLGSVF